jgi:glycosyltransferase involved in cell wall biosynthesis
MKLMFLVHEDGYGGGSRQTFYILQHVIAQKHQAILVSNASSSWLGQQIQSADLPVVCHFNSSIQRSIHPVNELRVLFFLLRVMWLEKPDIVVMSTVKLIGLGSVAAWLMQIPRKIAVIRGQGAAPGSWMMSCIYAMEWLLARLGVRFVTVCEYDRQQMLRRRLCPPTHVTTIHNGSDISLFAHGKPHVLRQHLGIPPEAFVIGMVGRLTPQKRYDAFIHILTTLCRQYPQVYGLLIGDGRDRDRLQQVIEASGFSDRIRITAFMSAMPDVYAGLDLSVLLTRYEGCSNALMESAAAGLPILADDVCGNAEIVHHGHSGYIIAPHDLAGAVAYATQFIEDSTQCQRMGSIGQTIAVKDFNRDIQIARLVEHILESTEKGPY